MTANGLLESVLKHALKKVPPSKLTLIIGLLKTLLNLIRLGSKSVEILNLNLICKLLVGIVSQHGIVLAQVLKVSLRLLMKRLEVL
jgi:hypothetical protein